NASLTIEERRPSADGRAARRFPEAPPAVVPRRCLSIVEQSARSRARRPVFSWLTPDRLNRRSRELLAGEHWRPDHSSQARAIAVEPFHFRSDSKSTLHDCGRCRRGVFLAWLASMLMQRFAFPGADFALPRAASDWVSPAARCIVSSSDQRTIS